MTIDERIAEVERELRDFTAQLDQLQRAIQQRIGYLQALNDIKGGSVEQPEQAPG